MGKVKMAKQTKQTIPSFKVNPPSVETIGVDGKVYNPSFKGPTNWHQLREADYGRGFRQGTFGDNFRLAHSAYMNQRSKDRDTREYAKEIVGVSQNHFITGNTALYGGEELIFAVDFPQVEDSRIAINQKDLEARLSKRQIGKVILSEDSLVRAMPRSDVREGDYTSAQIRKSQYPLLLTGDKESSEKTAQIMKKIKKPGYLFVPSVGAIRCPVLVEGGDGLGLGGYWYGFDDGRCSFGVRQ